MSWTRAHKPVHTCIHTRVHACTHRARPAVSWVCYLAAARGGAEAEHGGGARGALHVGREHREGASRGRDIPGGHGHVGSLRRWRRARDYVRARAQSVRCAIKDPRCPRPSMSLMKASMGAAEAVNVRTMHESRGRRWAHTEPICYLERQRSIRCAPGGSCFFGALRRLATKAVSSA